MTTPFIMMSHLPIINIASTKATSHDCWMFLSNRHVPRLHTELCMSTSSLGIHVCGASLGES